MAINLVTIAVSASWRSFSCLVLIGFSGSSAACLSEIGLVGMYFVFRVEVGLETYIEMASYLSTTRIYGIPASHFSLYFMGKKTCFYFLHLLLMSKEDCC